ncbi:DUF6191 domain-containing protein [Kitasatospora sp. NPDC097605]|uniref:DUF6191 domain-containing protein n=1 Tax=Kitasatospora sp. NPDC097605 TaxID=3157226 RepID=UPI00332B8E64
MGTLLSGAAGGLLLPAFLVVVFFLGAAGRRLLARRGGRGAGDRGAGGRGAGGRGAGAAATEELHALLYPGKRAQLEQRRVELVLREDGNGGAPGRTGIDLTGGRAVIRGHGARRS